METVKIPLKALPGVLLVILAIVFISAPGSTTYFAKWWPIILAFGIFSSLYAYLNKKKFSKLKSVLFTSIGLALILIAVSCYQNILCSNLGHYWVRNVYTRSTMFSWESCSSNESYLDDIDFETQKWIDAQPFWKLFNK
ncbi:MAG: hypothetical protein ABIT47_00740 [Candidatus Paceibacterota bacterium]